MIVDTRERLECDACGSISVTSPQIALMIDGWTTCYDGHLCRVCTVIHLAVAIAHIVRNEPDCGTAMKLQIPTTYAYDVIPEEWNDVIQKFRSYLHTFRSIPIR